MKVFMLSVFCCSDLSNIEIRPQTSVQFKMRNFTQRKTAVSYRRSGTAWSLKKWPIGFPETSVWNYSSKQPKSPKNHRSHSHGDASLKLRISTIRADGRTDGRPGKQADRNSGEKRFTLCSFQLRKWHKPTDRNTSITCIFFIWPRKESWFDSKQGQRIFLPFKTSRLALGSNQPPTEWSLGPLLGIKRPECKADRSPPDWMETISPLTVCLQWLA